MQTMNTWPYFQEGHFNLCELRMRTFSFHVRTHDTVCLTSKKTQSNCISTAFNLIEIFGLILPFEWWMRPDIYERLNNYVMGVLYFPLLIVTAAIETRDARRIRWNRHCGEADDTIHQEWEELAADVDFDVTGSDDWRQIVHKTKPNVEVPTTVLEIRELKEQVRVLTESIRALEARQEHSALNGELDNGSTS